MKNREQTCFYDNEDEKEKKKFLIDINLKKENNLDNNLVNSDLIELINQDKKQLEIPSSRNTED